MLAMAQKLPLVGSIWTRSVADDDHYVWCEQASARFPPQFIDLNALSPMLSMNAITQMLRDRPSALSDRPLVDVQQMRPNSSDFIGTPSRGVAPPGPARP